MISLRSTCLGLTLMCLCSCTQGLLYRDVTIPLDTDMNRTPRSPERGVARSLQIREPLTAARIAAEWDSRSIGDAVQRSELETAEYADSKIFSLVFGIYREDLTEVWGEASKSTETSEQEPDR